MPRRGRLKAVGWLLFAALCQVSSPAQAAFMGAPGFGCYDMRAAPAAAGDATARDMAAMHMAMGGMDMSAMAGMDMSGMAGMDHSGSGSEPAGKNPAHCNFDCCNGGLIAHAALVTPLFSFAGLGSRIAQRITFGLVAEAPRDVRSRLRPAIRAPPQDF